MHTNEAQDKATERAAKHARELAEVQKEAGTLGEEKRMLQQQLASAERLRRTMIDADRVHALPACSHGRLSRSVSHAFSAKCNHMLGAKSFTGRSAVETELLQPWG